MVSTLAAGNTAHYLGTSDITMMPSIADVAGLNRLSETIFTRDNLERAFGGVLRRFTLGGTDLHEDDDSREISILTDDERPFVHYGDKLQKAERLE